MLELLAMPIVRKIASAGLALAAVGAILFACYHAGLHAGQRQEAGKETETDRVQFTQLAETYKQSLASAEARAAASEQLALQYAQLAIQASQRIQTAQTTIKAETAKVQAIPDAGLKADLELKLGGPLENPAVLRKDDEIVSQAPGKDALIKAGGEKINALVQQLDAVNKQIMEVTEERDASISAYNTLVPLYAQAFNAAIVPHRKWYCLFLCSKKTALKLPDPVTLQSVMQPKKKGGKT